MWNATLLAEDGVSYKIIETKTGSKLSLDELAEKLASSELILFGEEHDDLVGHTVSRDLYSLLVSKSKRTLSLEMLERDQQTITDEFIFYGLAESQFLNSTVHWKNFKDDYFPLVKIARDNKLKVVCANPPRRFVNQVSKSGIIAYQSFPPHTRVWVPEPSLLTAFQSSEYVARLRELMSEHSHGSLHSTENFFLAQSVWDQGMADAISWERHSTGLPIFHLNGRFHSDRVGGLTFRLRKMGHNPVVLSSFPEGKENPEEFAKIADFVILTKSR
ncbi:MAG: ChaN family lipoprotein [Leptospira sp.]|nr:ChaN family lipoprotein [Leptospira sp.]